MFRGNQVVTSNGKDFIDTPSCVVARYVHYVDGWCPILLVPVIFFIVFLFSLKGRNYILVCNIKPFLAKKSCFYPIKRATFTFEHKRAFFVQSEIPLTWFVGHVSLELADFLCELFFLILQLSDLAPQLARVEVSRPNLVDLLVGRLEVRLLLHIDTIPSAVQSMVRYGKDIPHG